MVVSTWPKSFKHYRPRSQKVYGCICISRHETYLLIQGRQTGIWSFPKGHLKGNEMIRECALREMKEETGLDLRHHIPFATKRISKESEYFMYRFDHELEINPEDVNEVMAYGWFSIEEMNRMTCNRDINLYLLGLRRGYNVFREDD